MVCVVCNAPEIVMLAFPTFTDPVMPGDVVGNGPLLAVIVPVPPVADVGEAAGETLPVGDASGGGPSELMSLPPPQPTSRTSADVGTIRRFRRPRASFTTADCNPGPRDADPARAYRSRVVA